MNNQIYTNQRLKMPLVEQSKQAAANLDLAMASLEKMKSASVGAYTAQQIAQQEETVKSLQYQYSKIQSRVEAYDRSISTATEKLNIVKEQAGAIQQNMAAAGVDTEKMAAAAKRASKGAMGFATQLKYAMSSILLYGALFQVFSKFTEWIGKVIKSNDAASASVGPAKSRPADFGTAHCRSCYPSSNIFSEHTCTYNFGYFLVHFYDFRFNSRGISRCS